MKSIAIALTAFLLVTPLFAQTNQPVTQTREPWDWTKHRDQFYDQKDDSLTPNIDSVTLAAGVAFVDVKTRYTKIGAKGSGTQLGGYIAGDWFISPSVALRAEFLVFSKSDSVNVNGSPVSVSETDYIFDVGGKFYPLKLSEFNQWRVQPFTRLALGAIFRDTSVSGEDVNVSPAILGIAGGGLDVVITSHLSLTAEADYFATLTDASINIGGTSLTIFQYGFQATAGVRYRF